MYLTNAVAGAGWRVFDGPHLLVALRAASAAPISSRVLGGVVAAAATGVVALGAAGWYAQRRIVS